MAQTLPDVLHAAFLRRKARERTLTWTALAEEADVPYPWLRQVTSGRTKQPKPEWLVRLGESLGVPAETVLAMTDQLGEAKAVKVRRDAAAPSDLAAILRAQGEELTLMRRELTALRSLLTLLLPARPDPETAAELRRTAAALLAELPVPSSDRPTGAERS